MNRIIKSRFALLLIGTLLFNYLFWNESHGINILIFSIFVVLVSFYSGLKTSLLFWIILVGLFLTSFAIAYHGSLFTIFMFYVSIVLFIGYLHEQKLKSVVYIIAASITSLFRFPGIFYKSLNRINENRPKIAKIFKIIKLSLIPLLVLSVFYFIFINANPVFEKYANSTFDIILYELMPFLNLISFQRLSFFILGIAVNAWFLFKTDLGGLVLNETFRKEELIRHRFVRLVQAKEYFNNLKDKTPEFYKKKFALSLKLKNEFISALVLLILVNVLLFIVNIIDIKWVWFGFKYSENFDLRQFVHEGTYLLIISILLSIGIMLYFFRRNLNFYHNARWIKVLSFIWIVQNIILTISVAIRNFHYITYWGLAYKRIGVILFLIAVTYGLISLFIKIRKNKTSFYLIKRNTLAIYIILVSASLFNWDDIIARHNLNHPLRNHMETSYLLSLSDKILPYIDQKQIVLEQNIKYNTYVDYSPYTYKEYYQIRVKLFIENMNKKTWLSWNYKNWQAYQYYKNKLIKR